MLSNPKRKGILITVECHVSPRLGHDRAALMNKISALIRRVTRQPAFSLFSLPCEDTTRGSSANLEAGSHQTPDLQAP